MFPPARSSVSLAHQEQVKAPLIRCVNLLERPTQGRVEVDGVDLNCAGRAGADAGTPQYRYDLPAF